MTTAIREDESVSVPGWVTNLETFRRWAHADDFPQEGRIWWLPGEVWVDMSNEQVFSHVLVKTKVTSTLDVLVTQTDLGVFLTDGVLLSNFAADVSGNPDGMFLSYDTLGSDRVRLIEGAEGGFTEIQGSPDMVLEIISPGSVKKDDVTLRLAYWEASIKEYWIIDARDEPFRFDILRRTSKGYANTRKQDGWVRSRVFGRSFRLVPRQSRARTPSYALEVE